MITGGSSGRATALVVRLGRRGELPTLGARREQELKKAASQSGTRALAVAADITKMMNTENSRMVEGYFRDVGAFKGNLARHQSGAS